MAWGRGSGRRSPLPPGWGRLRAGVLERDGFRCVICGDVATDVDHVGDRDDHSPGNLRSLCRDCHKRRTWLQSLESKRRNRGAGRRRGLRASRPHPGYKNQGGE